MTRFGVVTANMPVRMGARHWQQYHHDYIRPVASIVCCQESPSRQDDVRVAYDTKNTGWRWLGQLTPLNQPFIINTHVWEVLSHHSQQSTPATDVGHPGAGPDVLLAKYIHWVVLRHKDTGQRLRVYNNHAVPSIYLRIRDKLHEEHMRDLAAAIRPTRCPVVAVGDMNAEWSNPNFNPLRKAHLHLDNPDGPTHGHHQIDLVLSRGGRKTKLKVVGGKILPVGAPNDHHGVLVDYEFETV